jgi:hypothetical protein
VYTEREPGPGARALGKEQSKRMGWTLFFMVVILKIPMAAALYIVWWAVRQEPESEEDLDDGRNGPRRKPPRKPRSPRRGPVGGGACKPATCGQVAAERLEQRAPLRARRA